MSSASFQVDATTWYLCARSRVMPRYWLPWPGYMCANLALGSRGASSMCICWLFRNECLPESAIPSLAKAILFSNWGQLVATMESLMPSGLKPKEDRGRALESLFPVGWSSKVGVPSNSSAEISPSLSRSASSEFPLTSNTPPSNALRCAQLSDVGRWASPPSV